MIFKITERLLKQDEIVVLGINIIFRENHFDNIVVLFYKLLSWCYQLSKDLHYPHYGDCKNIYMYTCFRLIQGFFNTEKTMVIKAFLNGKI